MTIDLKILRSLLYFDTFGGIFRSRGVYGLFYVSEWVFSKGCEQGNC